MAPTLRLAASAFNAYTDVDVTNTSVVTTSAGETVLVVLVSHYPPYSNTGGPWFTATDTTQLDWVTNGVVGAPSGASAWSCVSFCPSASRYAYAHWCSEVWWATLSSPITAGQNVTIRSTRFDDYAGANPDTVLMRAYAVTGANSIPGSAWSRNTYTGGPVSTYGLTCTSPSASGSIILGITNQGDYIDNPQVMTGAAGTTILSQQGGTPDGGAAVWQNANPIVAGATQAFTVNTPSGTSSAAWAAAAI